MNGMPLSVGTALLIGSLYFCAPLARAQAPSPASAAPKQPIAFSHKKHAGDVKVPCKMCHQNPDPGDEMTVANAPECMLCHRSVKQDSPEIRRVASFAENKTPIPWERVYGLPSFVVFSHRTHLAKGNTCSECHGEVATREVLFRETNMTMGGCMDCHRVKKASLECSTCHDLPN